MTRPALITCAIAALSLAACRKVPSAPVAPPTACAAHAALEQIDTRVAVPLLPMMANHQKQNMRDHLLAVQEIVLAAGRDDFSGVETAAGRIGYSPQMGQMCTHMGAGAPGFADQALAFHRTADTIARAARAHDRAAVMAALGTTLQACTGCHETFRQRPVDQETWSQLTATAAGPAAAPGLSSRP